MKLAIMQPYFFPYLGYFQLIKAVDKFVIYDDVNFIKQGWINRNYILLNCKPTRITIPLQHASSFQTIFETKLSSTVEWRAKLLKTLYQAYGQAPYFNDVFNRIELVIQQRCTSISDLALASIRMVLEYLELSVDIQPTSIHYQNCHLKGQNRILDICRQEGCKSYLNLSGGRALYDAQAFNNADIDLRFIQCKELQYPQFGCTFIPNLSILDVLMFNEKSQVNGYLDYYELIDPCAISM